MIERWFPCADVTANVEVWMGIGQFGEDAIYLVRDTAARPSEGGGDLLATAVARGAHRTGAPLQDGPRRDGVAGRGQ